MKHRVGFVVSSRIPAWSKVLEGRMSPHSLWTGWYHRSPLNAMRFKWIAEVVNKGADASCRYELFKPRSQYAVIVFLKSMLPVCQDLVVRERGQGTRVIFDANTDYYSQEDGPVYFEAMRPRDEQRRNAAFMTRNADLVMASSRHLAEVCQGLNPRTSWIPDNVPDQLLPRLNEAPSKTGQDVQLWWSGESVKLFEFLGIASTLRRYRQRVHLNLVTNSLDALSRWPADLRTRFEECFRGLSVTWHHFKSIPQLLRLYARGGYIISPRLLDNPYNQSHSEWKITLGMACGLPAICSPVPSYRDVAARAATEAIRICDTEEKWDEAIAAAVNGTWGGIPAARAAQKVVKEHYVTSVVARLHLAAIEGLLSTHPR